jgi:hypothetical protein
MALSTEAIIALLALFVACVPGVWFIVNHKNQICHWWSRTPGNPFHCYPRLVRSLCSISSICEYCGLWPNSDHKSGPQIIDSLVILKQTKMTPLTIGLVATIKFPFRPIQHSIPPETPTAKSHPT